MKLSKVNRSISFLTFLSISWIAFSIPVTSQAEETLSMEKLLLEVKEGEAKDAAENKKREKAFIEEKEQQEARIRQAMQKVKALEEKSTELEKKFNANELLVDEKRKQRDERLGSLKELFGHLTGAAGDMRSRFRNSAGRATGSDCRLQRRLDR